MVETGTGAAVQTGARAAAQTGVLERPDGVRIAWESIPPAVPQPAAPPTVLLVHGFASSRSGNWLRTRWAEPLTEAGFRMLTLDLRGHGESSKPRTLAAYALPRFRDDLLAVLDAAGAPSAHVIGYSLGARLAWDLALRHPHRVLSLVLGGAPVQGSFAGFDHTAALAVLAGPRDLAGAADPGTLDPETARYLRMAATVAGNDPHALVRLAEAVRRSPFVPEARVPAQPMLFVTGADDGIAPAVRALAERLPHATALELPGRDHVSAVTSRVFKQAAVEFLQAPSRQLAASPGAAPPGSVRAAAGGRASTARDPGRSGRR
ncbi:alpha/beta hydrolase [Herbiconiux sp. CPCC 203407]|uniref:Alpha/beta hydrolase n=1 Tax=Herbiconiux oxytropis TaxID=2970915 RepID=A0AA42BWS1_9MICO|nr:alpha/beta hydrolase [Herbiconiux oxytropis]MCS5722743.1 alpha/beta hydrolase [Herbiconiux oxytropis]MCS5727013.1 alpha/beta hydrolase [Herbiconiux oxytropis]